MKQKLNLISIILMLLHLICIFIPGFYSFELWGDRNRYGALRLVSTTQETSMYVSGGFTIFLILAVALAVTMMLVAFFKKGESSFTNYAYVFTIVALAVLLFEIIYVALGMLNEDDYNWYSTFTPSFVAYISIALQGTATTLAVVARFKRFVELPKEVKIIGASSNNESSSTTDELKKYKELLDSGVITQEEFDAKKKQLLEL